jgi:hypothetical protein
MMQEIVNQPTRLIRFHKSFGLAGSREEQLFFHPELNGKAAPSFSREPNLL